MSESRAAEFPETSEAARRTAGMIAQLLGLCPTAVLFATDLAALGLVAGVAGWLAPAFDLGRTGPDMATCITLYLTIGVMVSGLLGQGGLAGRYDRRRSSWADLRQLVSAGASMALSLIAVCLLVGSPRLFALPIVIALAFPLVAGAAGLVAKRTLPLVGLWSIPVVVIGEAAAAAKLGAALEADPALGYRVVRHVEPGACAARIRAGSLRSVLDQSGAQYLAIADVGQTDTRLAIIQAALRERVPFATVPVMPAFTYDVIRLLSHDTVLLSSQHGLNRPLARVTKAMFDVAVASILILLLAPLLLLIGLAVRLDGGPALFRHRRLGVGKTSFDCLKFRTMRLDGNDALNAALRKDPALAAEWQLRRKLRNDPRVTPVGRFLRSTSLDELPQLFNVVRLEMSLVGPRPIVQAEAAFYGEEIAQYHAGRPGITGLWQVSGRSNTSYQERVALDVRYVNNWTMALDIGIVFRTIPAVLGRTGAH